MKHSLAIFGLWILCALTRPFRPPAKKISGQPRRVLIVQMAKLGDMVCTTPLFRAVKKAYPGAHVAVLGNSLNRALLEYNSDIDAYLVFDGLWRVYKKIRKGKFDTAVIVEPDIVSAALSYLSLVPHIAVPRVVGGRTPFESVWYRSLRGIAGFSVALHRMHHYAPGEYLRLLEPIGIQATDTAKHLQFSDAALQKTREILPKQAGLRYVGISPSSGDKVKNWGSVNFAVLANRLAERLSVRPVIFGAERDREEVEEMKKGMRCEYLDLSEKLSLDELKAAIAHLDLFVASDTGPVYIAEAFGIPTVDVLGPVDEREQAPRGEKHLRVVPPGPRVPQMFIMNSEGYDLAELKRQLSAISPEMVYEACAALLTKKDTLQL